MKPKKTDLQIAKEDGTMARVNNLLSLAHLLMCIASNLVGEAYDLLLSHHLMLGMLKKRFNDLVYKSDLYFKEFGSMVTTNQQKMEMFEDIDYIEGKLRTWAHVEPGWKPEVIDVTDQKEQTEK